MIKSLTDIMSSYADIYVFVIYLIHDNYSRD